MQNHIELPQRDDRGFTLVELLIVIVILGILAVVTVFAVRGIADRGQENAEATDLDTVETAIDAYWMEEGSNPTEQDLVDTGYLKDTSDLHDIAVGTDGAFTITNIRTGAVVSSGAAATAPAEPEPPAPIPDPPTAGPVNGPITNTTYAGYSAQQYGSGSHTVVVTGYDFNTSFGWGHFVSNNPAWYDTRMVYIYGNHPEAAIDAIIAENPDYILAGEHWYDELDAKIGGANYGRLSSGVNNYRDFYFENIY